MIKEVLAISGKPGLYRLISRGNNMLIVEALDETKKRMPAYASDRVVGVADISIYTDAGDDTPLVKVLDAVKTHFEGKPTDFNPKKADTEQIVALFGEVVPSYDTDRVHISDMRKVFSWYNILVRAGITDFVDPAPEASEASEASDKATAE